MKKEQRFLCVVLVIIMALSSAPLQGFVGLQFPSINIGLKASAATYTSGIFKYTLDIGKY